MRQNVATLGADSLANADLPSAFRDAHEHDVHHADASDNQAYRSDCEHQNENQAADLVPQIEKIVRSEERKIIRFVIRKAALAAQQVAHFFDGLADLRRIRGLRENNVIFLVGIKFAERGHRHHGDVVFGIRAARNSLLALFARADDAEELAVDSDFFSDAVGNGLWKKYSCRVVAEQHHGHVVIGIRLIEHSPVFDLQVEDAADRGRISLEDHVLCAVDAAAQVRCARSELRHENAHRRGSRRDMRQLGHVLGPFRLQFLSRKPFARGPRERSPREAIGNDGVRAQLPDSSQHIVIQAVDHGADSDDRGDADDDAENGQCRAQRIFSQRVQREQHFAAKLQRAVLANQGTHRKGGGLRQCFSERSHRVGCLLRSQRFHGIELGSFRRRIGAKE